MVVTCKYLSWPITLSAQLLVAEQITSSKEQNKTRKFFFIEQVAFIVIARYVTDFHGALPRREKGCC